MIWMQRFDDPTSGSQTANEDNVSLNEQDSGVVVHKGRGVGFEGSLSREECGLHARYLGVTRTASS